jgi:helicase
MLATITSLPGIHNSELVSLFSKTLSAIQCKKVTLDLKMDQCLHYLLEEGLAEKRGARFIATDFGRRISMLYIDPATGVMFKKSLESATRRVSYEMGLLYMIVSSPDFVPKLHPRSRDWDQASDFLKEYGQEFISPLSKEESDEFPQHLRSLLVLHGWIDELHEDVLLDRYGVEPGDLYRAVENAEWLLYSLYEIAGTAGRSDVLPELDELRRRVKYGVKSELVPLTRLEGVGRVRARSLYDAGYTDTRKIASASIKNLSRIPRIGETIAERMKNQLDNRKP